MIVYIIDNDKKVQELHFNNVARIEVYMDLEEIDQAKYFVGSLNNQFASMHVMSNPLAVTF
jgi:hypothetical protein